MSDQPWTIESIRDALRDPDLAQRFLGEINEAPAHQLLHVFAKWESIAKNRQAAFTENQDIIAREQRGEGPAEGSVDVTAQVLAEAARIRSRGAA
ncbi:hypothetical protein ABZ686_11660 [Streptomyces sp. NPDC006992]|uniref:hypothetical protein n=1 Tax=unclassified Streptomyces TaxID=2593676 RepID=UPI0033F909B2